MTDATQHFKTEAAGTPTAPGRYVDVNAITSLELVPGLLFRPVLGERTMLNFVVLRAAHGGADARARGGADRSRAGG